MQDAVIVATARTPIGKAYRGAFNNLEAPSLARPAVQAALSRAGLSGAEVEDMVFGAALTQGTGGVNIARHRPARQRGWRDAGPSMCLGPQRPGGGKSHGHAGGC